jgi:DNA-binding beta-propeller fold protein YncE
MYDRLGMGRFVASAALALLGIALTASSALASNVYVTNLNDGSVSQYAVGPDGALSPLSPPVIPAGPGHSVGVAISPDGSSVYVANLNGSISQYDVGPDGALSPKSPASVPAGSGAAGIAISPDGKNLYVGDSAINAVSEFDVGPGGGLVPKTPATVPAGAHPEHVAVAPDGKSVYVSNQGEESVSQFDLGAGGVLTGKSPAAVHTGESPEGMAVSPDGKSLYVIGYDSHDVSQFDIGATGLLTPKSPATVAAGEEAVGVAVSPDGRSAYVASEGDEFVRQYDIGTGGLLAPKSPPAATSGPSPNWIAVSPGGRSVYASVFGSGVSGGGVSQYDVGAGGALAAKAPAFVAAGSGPAGVAITPDQSPTASLSVSGARARPGVPVGLDASASSDPDGSVALYDWSFGDGEAASNAGPRPDHIYGKPGTYQVSVTVTDDEGCSTALIFTGQTDSCNGSASASQSQAVKVAYPGVKVRCPKRARPNGCKFKLQAVTKKRKGKAQSAGARAKLKAGKSKIVSLKPKKKFRERLALAKKILVRETVVIKGARRIRYPRLKVVR